MLQACLSYYMFDQTYLSHTITINRQHFLLHFLKFKIIYFSFLKEKFLPLLSYIFSLVEWLECWLNLQLITSGQCSNPLCGTSMSRSQDIVKLDAVQNLMDMQPRVTHIFHFSYFKVIFHFGSSSNRGHLCFRLVQTLAWSPWLQLQICR